MKIKSNAIHKITFRVANFYSTEGGMEVDFFGEEINSLEEALYNFDLAKIKSPTTEWIIACNVNREIRKG